MKRYGMRGAGYLLMAALLATTSSVSISVAQAQAQAADQRFTFDIPAKPVPQAVNDIGRITGLSVVFRETRAITATGGPVQGEMTAVEALETVLNGSGLTFRFSNPTTVQVFDPATGVEETTVLQPITVEGQGETALGPVTGIVARQSATATKTDTPILKTPQTINVVGREQMERQGARQVREVLRYTPGVTADVRGDISRFDQIYFRGFGAPTDSFQYLDGLRLPRASTGYLIPQAEAYSLERVEVLKGPASVLYGQTPLGGIVNMVTKRPTEETFHEVEFVTGSNDLLQAGFDTGGPVDDDGTVLYRISGMGKMSDTSVQMTEEERISIAPSITWRPNAGTSLTVLGHYQRDPEGGYYGVLPSSGTILPNPYGAIPRDFFDGSPNFEEFDRTQVGLGYDFRHDFGDGWRLHQNLRYLHMTLDSASVYSSGFQADNRTLNRYALWSEEQMDAVNVDTNIHKDFATGPLGHGVIAGVDYQWSNWQQVQGFGAAPGLDVLDPDYDQPITRPAAYTSADLVQNLVGIYGQDQVTFGNLSVLLGGRVDIANITNDNLLAGSHTDETIAKFTWRAGLVYAFDNGIAPYASYSTSFDPTVTANAYGDPFEPTTGEQYEVGVKYQPPGMDALFTLSAFQLTKQNVLTQDPASVMPNAYVQSGEVRSRGLEFEAKLSPIDGLNLIGGVSWVDPEVTESNGTDLGKRPVSVARLTGSAWADYTVQDGPAKGIGLGAGVRYVGETYADPANTQKVPGYVVADATLRYDFANIAPQVAGLSAAVNVSNLFDKTTYTCNAPNFCNYGQGRTVVGTLKYRW